MTLSPEYLSKVSRIDSLIQRYLRESGLSMAKPKDVMPYLISNGVFGSDNRKGNPLRKVLRRLDDEGRLDLIPGLKVERRGSQCLWFLTRV